MKHLHMMLAVLSVSFFTLRFVWSLIQSKQLDKKWVKISPHIIDTGLLLAGITMWFQLALNPLEQMWFAEKLIGVVAYIASGFYALKYARNNTMKVFAYLGAIGWVMLVARVAMTKQPLLLG